MSKRNIMFQHFAKKWGLAEPTVRTIFLIIENNGGKYGRSSRDLRGMGVMLSARKLKYFYQRVRLENQYGTRKDIGDFNYNKLIKKKL